MAGDTPIENGKMPLFHYLPVFLSVIHNRHAGKKYPTVGRSEIFVFSGYLLVGNHAVSVAVFRLDGFNFSPLPP
jgi:hypothetical protein